MGNFLHLLQLHHNSIRYCESRDAGQLWLVIAAPWNATCRMRTFERVLSENHHIAVSVQKADYRLPDERSAVTTVVLRQEAVRLQRWRTFLVAFEPIRRQSLP
jgi:hypothetical protein